MPAKSNPRSLHKAKTVGIVTVPKNFSLTSLIPSYRILRLSQGELVINPTSSHLTEVLSLQRDYNITHALLIFAILISTSH